MNMESDTLIKPYISPSKPMVTTTEGLTDYSLGHVLPDYLIVNVKDPIRQWKINHENEMFTQLITSQKELRETQHSFKLDVANMLRKVPIDLITREFLNKEKLTIDGRAYIIDKLVPVVVLGLEKVLEEAEKRSLIGQEERDPNFNPIDFLAQYLMRNNPLFANYNEASPYVRGLRQVVEELKVEIFQLSDNRLAKVKASATTKRDEREKEEARKKREAKRRIEIYQQLFDQFLVRDQIKVDYETVHVSIKSFSEIVDKFPPEMKTKLAPILTMRRADVDEKMLSRKDFGLLISHYADNMPLDIFDQFAEHLSKCAQLYRSQMEKETRRKLLSELFITCDLDEMGLLDRQRILMLFDQFYSNTPENIKMMLRDPRHWPICDYKKEKAAETKQPADAVVEDLNQSNVNQDTEESIENDDENVNAADEEISEKETEIADIINEMEDNAEKVLQKANDDIDENIDVEEDLDGEALIQGPSDSLNIVRPNDRVAENIEAEIEEESKIDQSRADAIPISSEIGEDVEIVEDTNIEQSSADAIPISSEIGEDVEIVEDTKIEQSSADAIIEDVDTDVQGEKVKSPYSEDEDPIDYDKEEDNVIEDANEILNDLEDVESRSFSREDDDVAGQMLRETTKLSTTTSFSSPYDEENITFPQFFQVTEEFLGDIPSIEVLDDLIEFLREGYQETPDERLKRLKKAHRMVISARRKNVIDELFNIWDRDNAGYLSMKEVSEMLNKYRNGHVVEGTKAAKKEARMRQTRVTKDVKLNRKEFRVFIYTVARVSDMLESETEVETMVRYFIGLIQKTYEEKLRGEARRKWLNSISWAGEISCGSIDGVYRAVFQALYKDVESHGGGKIISGSIALLENNEVEVTKRGKYTLHFVAATNDQSEYVVGKKLDRSTKNISFQVIYTGNVVSLTHASASSLVVYWSPNITENAKEGSLVIVPIKDDLQRVFGVLSVDTLNDPAPEKASFFSYEIAFFQGVSKQFSTTFQQVEMLRRLVKISESAMTWICRRTESVKGANFFLREKKDQRNASEFVLRHVLSSNDRGEVHRLQKPTRVDKADNLFKMYLFDTIETSQSITADAYGDRNIAIPLRDLDGIALAVMEINIGVLRFLPSAENTDVAKMMDLLQQSCNEIIKISQLIDVHIDVPDDDESPDSKSLVTTASGSSNVDIIFDQYMLAELRASVAKLDAQAYAEIRSYKDPPVTIHAIIRASLALLYPKEGHMGQFENWEKCKKYISLSLSKLILAFDPFGDISMIPMEVVQDAMQKIPRSEIDKHSSKPALDLYNWVFCCVTLIDHCLNV